MLLHATPMLLTNFGHYAMNMDLAWAGMEICPMPDRLFATSGGYIYSYIDKAGGLYVLSSSIFLPDYSMQNIYLVADMYLFH